MRRGDIRPSPRQHVVTATAGVEYQNDPNTRASYNYSLTANDSKAAPNGTYGKLHVSRRINTNFHHDEPRSLRFSESYHLIATYILRFDGQRRPDFDGRSITQKQPSALTATSSDSTAEEEE